jgi:hypothetical protein
VICEPLGLIPRGTHVELYRTCLRSPTQPPYRSEPEPPAATRLAGNRSWRTTTQRFPMGLDRHGSRIGPLDRENLRFPWEFRESFESNIAYFDSKASFGQKPIDRDKPKGFLGFFRFADPPSLGRVRRGFFAGVIGGQEHASLRMASHLDASHFGSQTPFCQKSGKYLSCFAMIYLVGYTSGPSLPTRPTKDRHSPAHDRKRKIHKPTGG